MVFDSLRGGASPFLKGGCFFERAVKENHAFFLMKLNSYHSAVSRRFFLCRKTSTVENWFFLFKDSFIFVTFLVFFCFFLLSVQKNSPLAGQVAEKFIGKM